jgi:hypothetical protein
VKQVILLLSIVFSLGVQAEILDIGEPGYPKPPRPWMEYCLQELKWPKEKCEAHIIYGSNPQPAALQQVSEIASPEVAN